MATDHDVVCLLRICCMVTMATGVNLEDDYHDFTTFCELRHIYGILSIVSEGAVFQSIKCWYR